MHSCTRPGILRGPKSEQHYYSYCYILLCTYKYITAIYFAPNGNKNPNVIRNYCAVVDKLFFYTFFRSHIDRSLACLDPSTFLQLRQEKWMSRLFILFISRPFAVVVARRFAAAYH